MIVKLEKPIVGFKKVMKLRYPKPYARYLKPYDTRVIELIIPAGALVHYPDPRELDNTWFKLRASEAYVAKGNGKSSHDFLFKYREGEIVKPESKFSRVNKTCASGIHFFLDPEEAALYNFG